MYLWNAFLRINFISQNKQKKKLQYTKLDISSFCLHKVSQKSLVSNLHFI